MAKKTVGFPDIVYVYREKDGDMSYLLCTENLEEVASIGKKTPLGMYRLESTVTATVEVHLVGS